MKESEYLNGVWKRIRKAGPSGQAVINTGLFDSVFGGEESRKQLMLKQMGDRRDYRDKSLDIANRRLDLSGKNADRRYGLAKDRFDWQKDDMNEGAILTGLQIPLNLHAGLSEANAVDNEAEAYNKRTKAIRGLIGG
jgi:hypothetical protein